MIETILGIVTGGWSSILPWVIGAAGVIGTLLGVYAKGRGDAKAKAKTATLETIIKAEKDRANAETDAAAGGAADRLHRDFQRK